MPRFVRRAELFLACLVLVAAGQTTAQTFTILHYALDVKLAMVDENLSGHTSITCLLGTSLPSLTMNQAKLTFDSLKVDGVPRVFSTNDTAETFTVALAPGNNAGDTVHLDIWYRRVVGIPRPGGRWGYYFFPDTIPGTDANLGYTMAEPSDARFWFPCLDDPKFKATAEIRATVPSGYVAASNGRLKAHDVNIDGTETWSWREDHPISTYLICVTASRWTVVTQQFVRTPGDTLPVQYYVWNADAAAAQQYLPTVCAMIAAYSKLFGPYPFDKYGMAAVTPFGYGGMEHQSMTTLHRSIAFDDDVVCHELAHQWWGDLVTCAGWPEVWLNESFATYSEALWAESQGGRPALFAYMKDNLRRFNSGSWFGSIYDPEGQGFPLFSQSVYSKGGWVLHMLRGVVGDSTFFKGLAAYRSAHAPGPVTTHDFQISMESVFKKDLSWFFNEWIYSPGWPVYSFTTVQKGDSLAVTVRQRQSEIADRGFPTIFTLPLPIHAYHGTQDSVLVMWDSLPSQTMTWRLPFVPDSIALDPEGWILMERSTVTSLPPSSEPLAFHLFQNYPNPFNPSTTCRFTLAQSGHVSLTIFDVLGREVATLIDDTRAAGEYTARFDGKGCASGLYFARLTSGGAMSVTKMMLVK